MEVTEMCRILIVVMVSQVYVYVQTHQKVSINMCVLCINYASIELKKRSSKKGIISILDDLI